MELDLTTFPIRILKYPRFFGNFEIRQNPYAKRRDKQKLKELKSIKQKMNSKLSEVELIPQNK